MTSTVLFTSGRFGDAVAERLAAHLPVSAVHRLTADVLDPLIAGADFVAAALWRPDPRACDALDAACARAKIRWAPAVLDQSDLWIGPLADATAGACYACFRRRRLTHHDALDRELALQAAFDRDPALGIAGFCDPLVTIAAAGLADAARSWRAGSFRRVHLLECTVDESCVVRVHGCPRCGGAPAGDPQDRYIRHLSGALS